MPIINQNDAAEVEQRVRRIFDADSTDSRMREILGLFVELLDFDPADGEIGLQSALKNVELPSTATRVAALEGTNVVYIPLGTRRVRNAEASEAVRLVSQQLDGDLLVVFTNGDASQLHFIYPSLEGARPTLRRMVIERDLPRRTAVMQLSNIYWKWRELGSLHLALGSAFDVEAVTREFFAQYKRVFDDALASVAGFGRSDAEQEAKKFFAQTLFNRLMFIYFVSRKGWTSFGGDRDYLNALWKDYRANELRESDAPNFHYDRLRPLFFGGLNNRNSEDLTECPDAKRLIGDVPFLNGGLFERGELDDRSGVVVPDEVIRSVFDDLFNRFNFTVMESTPFDVEVAVDPEMLGKVFEELVTGRHESGAYYTPRPVVSFMCREALKGYLGGKVAGLSADAIAAFVDERSTDALSVSDARVIGRALDEVSVVDPACGSGAYLLGMIQELVELQTALYNAGLDAKSLYDLKLGIIERNLYGADLDRFAVNIAMLRLWLSLSIEYDDDGDPPALPNLDFKIVRGDSLLGPDPNPGGQADLFTDAIRSSKLGELKAEYMRVSDSADRKAELRQRIEAVEAELRETLGGAEAPTGSVDWRVQFAEAMERGGFDVAIANPPYVRQENIGANKQALTRQYSDAATARSDLYCYFYARGLELLRDGGMHVFVCSNSWLDVGYGAKLQEYLLNNAHVQTIYESAVERQFSTAQINTIISIARKGEPSEADATAFVNLREAFEDAIARGGDKRVVVKTAGELRLAGTDAQRRRFVGDKWGGKYLRAPDIYHRIIDKYGDKLIRLGDVATVKRGITTGANAFFYLTPERIAEFGIEPEYYRPVMTTPQESRSIAVDPAQLPKRLFMCNENKRDLRGTGALAYIEWGETRGYHQRSSTRSRRRWYSLGERNTTQLAMNYLIGNTARTFVVEDGLLFGDNFQELRSNAIPTWLLCAVLNSTVSQMMFNISGRANFGGGLMKIQTFEIEGLQIVNPQLLSEPNLELFNSQDWDLLNPSPERWKIDGMVFDALGLNAAEREAVYEGVTDLVSNRLRRAGSARRSSTQPEQAHQPSDIVAQNIVLRGKAIYDRRIREKAEAEHRGNFAVIDVHSEDCEIAERAATATRRLLNRRPGALCYTARIGHPTAYKMGSRMKVRRS